METKTLEQYFLAEMEALKAENEALRKKAGAMDEDMAHGVGTATPERIHLVMYDVDRQRLARLVRLKTEEAGSFDEWADGLTDDRLVAWALSNCAVTASRTVSDYVVEVCCRRLAVVAPAGGHDTGEVADLDAPFGWGNWVEAADDLNGVVAEMVAYEASRC
ncbi:hypothetical protein [uncultured Senegalimassilia sp.]|uniref:Uncharacterized protein n=1 Tax=Siphoviridae sp. ctqBc4 TaxID=2827945 RepID=A0A8S5SCB6_9CAUD|nr:hypothetical protein [uncultured Senegalimassilia sp.]DAF48585.1 MAG TPA: hypothetical protein [Siphoviridae sp. ctqBc4]